MIICATPGNVLSVTTENGGYRLRLNGRPINFYYHLTAAIEAARDIAQHDHIDLGETFPPSEPELLVEWLAGMVVALDGQLKAGA